MAARRGGFSLHDAANGQALHRMGAAAAGADGGGPDEYPQAGAPAFVSALAGDEHAVPGAGLITIQRQLGHNQIETTMRYPSPKNTRHRAEYQAYALSYV